MTFLILIEITFLGGNHIPLYGQHLILKFFSKVILNRWKRHISYKSGKITPFNNVFILCILFLLILSNWGSLVCVTILSQYNITTVILTFRKEIKRLGQDKLEITLIHITGEAGLLEWLC